MNVETPPFAVTILTVWLVPEVKAAFCAMTSWTLDWADSVVTTFCALLLSERKHWYYMWCSWLFDFRKRPSGLR